MSSVRLAGVAILGFCFAALAISAVCVRAAEPDKPAAPAAADTARQAAEKSVERLVEQARKSVVVISFTGRDGRSQGLGSGFVISPEGLIATNLHVLGEGRPISVQLSDGKKFDITACTPPTARGSWRSSASTPTTCRLCRWATPTNCGKARASWRWAAPRDSKTAW